MANLCRLCDCRGRLHRLGTWPKWISRIAGGYQLPIGSRSLLFSDRDLHRAFNSPDGDQLALALVQERVSDCGST